ncbi:methyltransferase [Micromonospora sp. ATCC 39149]|uniref:Methyltransferase n=1 Tax=Micromonospora carbonacea TaxID=47853 RepID=A0A7D5YB13_9ACTN|nr:50S ribosomal protein L11 methyltransferase [Micromonospora sp. ATCC 39149]EEP70794.1 methyltransferase [Micromonospora sp. ATCC 39149]QLJ97137.1 methyltransferase [Micromonospora carbonacea]
MLAPVRSPAAIALTVLEREIDAPGEGLDRLRLVPTPFVPEVRLHLAEDAIVWWARMEAAAGHALPPPYWASAWAGGQALARHLLDHPELAAGRRVLDLAAGSGLVAIAAALAGAALVVANDIDPYAVAAVTVNARANRVAVVATGEDLLDSDGGDADLLVAGDVFYDRELAARVLPFLRRAAARGSRVLVGDPGRGHLPRNLLDAVTSYRVPTTEPAVDSSVRQVEVLRPRFGGTDPEAGSGSAGGSNPMSPMADRP